MGGEKIIKKKGKRIRRQASARCRTQSAAPVKIDEPIIKDVLKSEYNPNQRPNKHFLKRRKKQKINKKNKVNQFVIDGDWEEPFET